MRRKVGQASVEEHPKGSGRWRVRARLNGKLATLIKGVSEAEALACADTYSEVFAADNGTFESGITLAQFGPGYLDRREKKGKRNIRTDRNYWKNHIEKDEIAGIALKDIRRKDVMAWLDRRKGPENTLKNFLTLIRGAFTSAVDRELMEANPARDVKVEFSDDEAADDLRGILDLAEQHRLLKAVPSDQRALVWFALTTGIRQAEQWWLHPDDIRGRVMTIRRSVGGKRPKSKKVRTLHLMAASLAALAGAPSNETYVWPAKEGGRRAQGKAPKGWHTWVKNAKIKRRIRWHDLRHTCATSLLAGWWDRKWTIDEVCQHLGHSSIKVTERYARLLADTHRVAAEQTEFPASSQWALPLIANRGKKPGSRLRDSNARPAVYENAAHSNTRTWLGPHGFPVGNSGISPFPAPVWALAYAAESVLEARAGARRPLEFAGEISIVRAALPGKVKA